MPWSSHQISELARDLKIPESHFTNCPLPFHEECSNLVSIGPDVFGREQKMHPHAATKWQSMREAAQEEKVILLVVSAFRGVEYQKGIIARKLATGQTIEQILRVSALPGFSEHHTGRLCLATGVCTVARFCTVAKVATGHAIFR